MKTTLIFLLLFACIAFLAWQSLIFWRDRNRFQRELQWYKRHYLRQQGVLHGYGQYCLRSLDGGHNWYNASEDNGRVRILGPADPKLLAELAGLDRLAKYAQAHGPINPADPAQQKLLTDAGFEVRRRS